MGTAGRELQTIDPNVTGIGMHRYTLDMRQHALASGVYFVRFVSSSDQQIAKFVW